MFGVSKNNFIQWNHFCQILQDFNATYRGDRRFRFQKSKIDPGQALGLRPGWASDLVLVLGQALDLRPRHPGKPEKVFREKKNLRRPGQKNICIFIFRKWKITKYFQLTYR